MGCKVVVTARWVLTGLLIVLNRTNSIPNILVTLTVTGLTPSRGSLYGGTLLTVTGQGFGTNTSLVEVMVGSHACTVDVLSNTELTCRVDYTGTTHTVTNQGTHKGTLLLWHFSDQNSIMCERSLLIQWTAALWTLKRNKNSGKSSNKSPQLWIWMYHWTTGVYQAAGVVVDVDEVSVRLVLVFTHTTCL